MLAVRTAAEIYEELDTQRKEQETLFKRREGRGGHCLAIICSHWTIADEGHVFFGPVVRALRNRAATLGWHTFSCAAGENWLEDNLVEACAEHGADALVILGGADGNPDLLELNRGGLPAVFVEYDTIGERSGHIGVDNETAFADIIVHLAEMGCTRIAHISGGLDIRVGVERLSAYRDTLRRLGYPVRAEYMETGDFGIFPHLAYESAQRLLALPEPPDAIACASDVQAVAVIKAIEEAGLHCPEDIAVTGFDDAPFASTMTPTLTTVRQPGEAMGVAAFDAAAAMVADPSMEPPVIRFDGQLVMRGSSRRRPLEGHGSPTQVSEAA